LILYLLDTLDIDALDKARRDRIIVLYTSVYSIRAYSVRTRRANATNEHT